jgi:hypothetical protein
MPRNRLGCDDFRTRFALALGAQSGFIEPALSNGTASMENHRPVYRFSLCGMVSLSLLTALAPQTARAQADNYPNNKAISIICDAAAGATPDVDARFVAAGLSKQLGQQVIVINHPGANGSIAARAASEAITDG